MKRFLNILRNKYVLITIFFLVWVLFFAQYDIITQWHQRKELKEMQQKIEYLEKEVERLQHEKQSIIEDPAVMEKYAREKYYMKKKNEDVYVFDTVKNME
jgi:cell division protein DivIC